jgi:2-keto-4-pentenoate hydratase/2-oxohepta-3-ene-1,7-dioic acid hydratase in catechol pathway
MKLIRYRLAREVSYGAVAEGTVYRLESDPWEDLRLGKVVASLEDAELLAPCQPSKIVAVGRNYAAHAEEHDAPVPSEPILFLKPPTTVIGPGAAIVYPEDLSRRVDHEAELAVVIGRRARHLRLGDAADFVLGYTCANDVTARDLQRRDGQWTRSKAFDTFCPLGPWIVTDLDISDLAIYCRVNGVLHQEGRTSEMLFPVDKLLAFISAVMTLEPGDVILTGTPAGVGPLWPGDQVEVEIEGIGTLGNEVKGYG